MKIELIEYEKDNNVEFKVGKKTHQASMDDYDLTEYAINSLESVYFPYQVKHIASELKRQMLDADNDSVKVHEWPCFVDSVVENPKHYQVLPGVEVIDIRKALLEKIPQDTSFEAVDHWSRSWEYMTRMWSKNGLEDAKKARVYLNWLIEKLENE